MIFKYDTISIPLYLFDIGLFDFTAMGWEMASLENNHGTGQGTIFDIELVTFDYSTRYREEHDRRVCLFADTNKYILR